MLATALGFTEPTLVVSTPGGQAGLVYPVGPVYDTALLKKVRANLFLQAFTVANSYLEVQIGLQLSDDAAGWNTSTTQPTFFANAVVRSSEGPTTNGAFEDISSLLTKKYVRFVFWVKNLSPNTALSTCLASMRIERQGC